MAAPSIILIFLLFSACTVSYADFDESIAIVGAGYSGLSTAFNLVRAGYTKVTIYDSASRIGGYFSSVEHNNVTHDMATYAITPAYWKFQEAMESIGVQFCQLDVDVVNTTTTPPTIVNVLKFIATLGAQTLNNPLTYPVKLKKQVEKYITVWQQLFGMTVTPDTEMRTERLFPTKVTDPDSLADLALPMEQFVEKYGLELLTPLFVQATDSQAYGPYGTTAALYYLAWVPPSLFTGELGAIPCGPYPSMQGIADAVYKYISGKVSLNLRTKVLSVIRSKSESDPVIVVEPTGRKVPYDRVILANKLGKKLVRPWLVKPVSKKERRAGKTMEELQIFSALVEAPRADAVVSNAFLIIDSDALTVPDPATSFWGALSAESRDAVSPNPFLSQPTVTRVSATYYYAERAANKRVRLTVQEQLDQLYTNLKKWDDATWTPLQTRRYEAYFQRWPPQQVLTQMPWAIADIQGMGKVYYVNSGACGFESVGHVFDCSDNLVKDYFLPVVTPAP